MKLSFKTIAIAIILAVIGTDHASAKAKFGCKYVDATTLTIINKAQGNGPIYRRIDDSKYEMRKSARDFMRHSTGIAISFRTDSRNIYAHWHTELDNYGTNTTPILHNGLDLYIKEDGEWKFAGVATPKIKRTEHEAALVRHMAEGEKECLVYLPMFNTIETLEIGVDKNAYIEYTPSPFKHKIVFVGSSITHGASAGHPGASYVARLGRALNAETPNIGLSGKCRLDNYYADIVCDTEADAFVFDAFSNSSAEEIKNRLYNFVERINKAHPGKPLIFLQTLKRDTGYFDLSLRKFNEEQREAARKYMAEVCKHFKDVYFIDPGIYVGEDLEGTIDGVHPNDIGTLRTVDNLLPKLKKILKKYGIKVAKK